MPILRLERQWWGRAGMPILRFGSGSRGDGQECPSYDLGAAVVGTGRNAHPTIWSGSGGGRAGMPILRFGEHFDYGTVIEAAATEV